MARQASPTIVDVAKIVKNIDLTPLDSNQYTGKSIIQIEHCLIEVLAEIVSEHQNFKHDILELTENCLETGHFNFKAFLRAFSALTRVRADHLLKYTNASPVGKYFDKLLDTLILAEEDQLKMNKPSTVKSAQILVALINNELNTCMLDAKETNYKIDDLWNHYFSKEQQSLLFEGMNHAKN